MQNDNSSSQTVQCEFGLGAVSSQSVAEATLAGGPPAASQEATLPIADTVTLTQASNSVSVACDAELTSASVLTASILAIKVSSLTETRDPNRG